MQIPSYQIQNVLKVYSRQLSQGKILNQSKFGDNKSSVDNVSISPEGKRQTIIDQVATNIVNRIVTEGPKKKEDTEIINQIEKEFEKKINFEKNKFTYTKTDENNEKTTHVLSADDSKLIVKRMTEIAQKIADNNMEL
mmetsp:Transcript_9549/g.5008  ORF Transcript_9549/g.5008 Transcript_9549/m.5008 type:complete len:138 (+) Transcript_9549:88-501(+)